VCQPEVNRSKAKVREVARSAYPHSRRGDIITAMDTVSLQDLQRDPASLLDRVEAGEHLVVSRGGRAVAELRPLSPPASGPRPFGLAAGSFTVPTDFDDSLPDDVLRDFEGR
jgi:prevent-host-death family protein